MTAMTTLPAGLNPTVYTAAFRNAAHGLYVVDEALAMLATHAVQQRANQLRLMLDTPEGRADAVNAIQADIPAGFGVRDSMVDTVVLAAARALAELDTKDDRD